MANDEKRKTKRVPLTLEATWEGGDAGRHEARVSDISRGGCYLDTIRRAALGDVVRLSLRLPDGNWLTVSGIVVYLQLYIGFAISFTNLSEEQRQLINPLIDAATRE